MSVLRRIESLLGRVLEKGWFTGDRLAGGGVRVPAPRTAYRYLLCRLRDRH